MHENQIALHLCSSYMQHYGSHSFVFFMQVHEAISREASMQFKAGIVMHEVRRGFHLKERLLRPATVKVSTGSGKQSASS
jgi:molecular chaperone GrpE (heat shock protein)